MMLTRHKFIKVALSCSLLILIVINNFSTFNNFQNSISLVRTTRLLHETKTTNEIIPQILWVNPHMQSEINSTVDENIVKIINKYKTAWGNENVDVQTLSTSKCEEAISKIPIKGASDVLLKFYALQDPHRYVCRLAVLFLYGGYCLQRDVNVIEPYIPQNDVNFAGVTDTNMFDASFIASTSYNSLLHYALQKYILLAKGELQLESSLPKYRFSEIMHSSFGEVTAANPSSKYNMVLLSADHLNKLQQNNEYTLVRKQDGIEQYCNYAIIDNSTKKTYFYAMFPGVDPALCDRVQPKIPHKIWFASRHELSKLEKNNQTHFNNIQNTIQLYQRAWGTNTVEYKILDYKACMNAIVSFHSSALSELYMRGSKDYANRGFDICRAVILLQHGGYFFNDEVEVVEPYVPDDEITFVGVTKLSGFFLSSFIAAEGEHPIMREIVTKYIMLSKGTLSLTTANAGGEIYLDSYNGQKEGSTLKSKLLVEKHLTEMHEIDVKSKQNYICNFIISNPDSNKVHFFSRIYAFGEYCVDTEN